MHTLKTDHRKRVRIPDAKSGQVYSYEPCPDGSIRLVPVVPRQQQRVVARLVKGHFEVPPGYRLDSEAIGRAVAEEQESRA